MKLTLVGYGTRGDVQPFVALGWTLRARGHEITVAAPRNMADFVERAGLRYAPLPVDIQANFATPEAQQMLANGRIQAFFKWVSESEKVYVDAMRAKVIEACTGADALVVHPLMEERASVLGAAWRIPVVPLYFFPVPPSRRFASPFITTRNLGPLNWFSHKLVLDMLWKTTRDEVAKMRRDLGVAPARASFVRQARESGLLSLLAYSERLFPRPDDWGEYAVVTGGIAPPDDLKRAVGEVGLDPELDAWLSAGPPPVFFGFGSMPVLDPERMIATLRRVLARLGVRGVIGAGWTQLALASDATLRAVGGVDHAALFARCAAAVHHGGAGTTYASLRAGLPTLVCAVFADQPFWGARCRTLGVGEVMSFKQLDEAHLVDKLAAVLTMRDRAAALGEQLRGERGLETVVRLLEEKLPTAAPPV